jgi:lipopolysaccharide transport system ATP-binding protein
LKNLHRTKRIVMSVAIKVENLSKAYQLGEIGTGTISRDLERWFAKKRGKEDPFLKIGEENDRAAKGTSDIVWSLRNLNFEILQGDTVGIIGRNGAGKSTLLKLLSRVTAPTSGKIKARGRIASLLEVGTGFHPELTGRENIYVNGAILGMRKKEIDKKFDEIVDFSGVERYVDTPVKRYSSGMYVRLAFAVSAHLDSEILIVDEVLAVGDYEFQEKCITKMKHISKTQGRTILFVSHNITVIKSLCNSGILLKNGTIINKGGIEKVCSEYQNVYSNILSHRAEWPNLNEAPGDSIVRILKVCAVNTSGEILSDVDITEEFFLEMQYEVLKDNHILWHSFNIYDQYGTNLFDTHSTTSDYYSQPHPRGCYTARVRIPGNFLNEGELAIGCAIFNHAEKVIHFYLKEVIKLRVIDRLIYPGTVTARGQAMVDFTGMVRPLLPWSVMDNSLVEV